MFYRMDPGILPSVRLADSVVIEPPYVHKRRKADEYILYLIKRGVMYLQEDGAPITLQAGDVCILDPACTHEGEGPPGANIFTFISVTLPSRGSMKRRSGIFRRCFWKTGGLPSRAIFSAMKNARERRLYLPKRYHMSDYGSLVRVTELFQRRDREKYEAAGKL